MAETRKTVKIGGMDLSVPVEYDEAGGERHAAERRWEPDPAYPELENPAKSIPPTAQERKKVKHLRRFFHTMKSLPTYTTIEGQLPKPRKGAIPKKVRDAFDNMPSFLDDKLRTKQNLPLYKVMTTIPHFFPPELRSQVDPRTPRRVLSKGGLQKRRQEQAKLAALGELDDLEMLHEYATKGDTNDEAAGAGAASAEDDDDEDEKDEEPQEEEEMDEEFDDEDDDGDYNAENYFDGGEEDHDMLGYEGGGGDDDYGEY